LVMWCNKITSDSARGKGGWWRRQQAKARKKWELFYPLDASSCERAFQRRINTNYAVRFTTSAMRQYGSPNQQNCNMSQGKP